MAGIALKEALAFDLVGTDGARYVLNGDAARGPVLAVFFKVACSTCQYAFPFIERLYEQWRPQGAQVWGISQDEAEPSRRFANEYGVTFPILIDEKPYPTSKAYGVRYTPTLFLIAPDDHIGMAGDGFSKSDLIDAQHWLAKYYSVTPPPLFRPHEKVPEYKPG